MHPNVYLKALKFNLAHSKKKKLIYILNNFSIKVFPLPFSFLYNHLWKNVNCLTRSFLKSGFCWFYIYGGGLHILSVVFFILTAGCRGRSTLMFNPFGKIIGSGIFFHQKAYIFLSLWNVRAIDVHWVHPLFVGGYKMVIFHFHHLINALIKIFL